MKGNLETMEKKPQDYKRAIKDVNKFQASKKAELSHEISKIKQSYEDLNQDYDFLLEAYYELKLKYERDCK